MRREARDNTGWEKIWHDFYDIVMNYRENNKDLPRKNSDRGKVKPHIMTKEKRGRLDCSCWEGYDNTIQEWARYLEHLSMRTCIDCGAPGENRWELGWIKPLCDKCFTNYTPIKNECKSSKGESMDVQSP